jgi:hypothetical protein
MITPRWDSQCRFPVAFPFIPWSWVFWETKRQITKHEKRGRVNVIVVSCHLVSVRDNSIFPTSSFYDVVQLTVQYRSTEKQNAENAEAREQRSEPRRSWIRVQVRI